MNRSKELYLLMEQDEAFIDLNGKYTALEDMSAKSLTGILETYEKHGVEILNSGLVEGGFDQYYSSEDNPRKELSKEELAEITINGSPLIQMVMDLLFKKKIELIPTLCTALVAETTQVMIGHGKYDLTEIITHAQNIQKINELLQVTVLESNELLEKFKKSME